MNLKGFFVAALSSALEQGMATCDDLVRHVTPEVLATHLPRPLWARLLTACLGASRVDAQLVVETIGIPNLCEHVPTPIMWACLEEIGVRSIGGTYVPKTSTASLVTAPPTPGKPAVPPIPPKPPKTPAAPLSITAPPEVNPPSVAATQPSPIVGAPEIPSPNDMANLFNEEDRPTGPANRTRTTTSQRFRASSTGIGRLANSSRRPQASAQATPPEDPAQGTGRTRRAATESEYEVVTNVSGSNDDWKSALAVEDEQLVDWANSEETVTGSNSSPDDPRKR